MMQQIAGFPYMEIEFTRDGQVHDQQQVVETLAFVDQGNVTDLLVISHGWNNDMAEAGDLYRAFLDRSRGFLDADVLPGLSTRVFGVIAVLWPSKKFADQELIPSGAAAMGSVVTDTALRKQIDDLKGVFSQPGADAALEKAKQLISRLQDSPQARGQFVELLRSVVPRGSADAEDASERFFKIDGAELLNRLRPPFLTPGRPGGSTGGQASSIGNPSGSAAGFELSFSGFKAAARRLLNYVTYYQMKDRAGTVGRDGLNPVLRQIRARRPGLKLHLIGHSFGGRLVIAAAVGLPGQPPVGVNTITLLQAAFSHNGFARQYDGVNDGFFRRLVTEKMVSGSVLISHTENDKAVGVAYPIASHIAGQAAANLGDKNDLFGGIGRNGAQKTPEAIDGSLLQVGSAYAFQPGNLYNLEATAFIKDHGDVTGGEIVFASLTAMSQA